MYTLVDAVAAHTYQTIARLDSSPEYEISERIAFRSTFLVHLYALSCLSSVIFYLCYSHRSVTTADLVPLLLPPLLL